MEAQFVASVLRGSAIPAFVLDDNVCRIYPTAVILVGGTKVLVSADDVERSAEVLLGVEAGESSVAGNLLALPLSDLAALIYFFRMCIRKWRTRALIAESLT
jgi:hypothetical protein